MTHDEIVAEIQARAKARSILTHYCGQATRCTGDRGQPDIRAEGRHGAAWIEVKSPYDRLDPPQTTWMHTIKGNGGRHYIIRETQLDDGTLDAILDELAYGQPVLWRTEAGPCHGAACDHVSHRIA